MVKDEIYEVITTNVHEYALENEIFAITDMTKPQVDNMIYVNGYISLNTIEQNMKPNISYKNTGKRVRNIETGVIGLVLREIDGYVQVLERICPKVVNTYSNGWDRLEIYGEEDE